MSTVPEHYATLLAPIYAWSVGGGDRALADGAADLAEALDLSTGPWSSGRVALDLGAGFGAHAIPLARAGFRVTAIDSSALLLDQLRTRADGLPIRIVEADLLDFPRWVDTPVDLVLCMGDTLTHLPDPASVERLFADVARVLAPQGTLLMTFRDHSVARSDDARVIAVRSDADRIHTCVLEERGDRLRVHDIVHERGPDGWRMRVSHYPKLRLSTDQVVRALDRAGMNARVDGARGGMVRITAGRRA